MERLLVHNWRRWPLLGIILAVTVVGILTNWSTAYASWHWAWFTGYAMGNLYGASQEEVIQTHFANHSSEYCPTDPASWWGWGKRIYLEGQPPVMHNQYGQVVSYSYYYLYDKGNVTCSMGSYWVDLYFGRWKPQFDPCTCPDPGVCYVGAKNTCGDAINFGLQWRHYYTY
jgi:hypothetical protein